MDKKKLIFSLLQTVNIRDETSMSKLLVTLRQHSRAGNKISGRTWRALIMIILAWACLGRASEQYWYKNLLM